MNVSENESTDITSILTIDGVNDNRDMYISRKLTIDNVSEMELFRQ